MKINSRILFVLCTICFFAFETNAKKIEIFRKGSEDGVHYDRINESHTLFKDKLSYTQPGNTKCGWNQPPTIGGESAEEIEDWVLEQVASGTKNGDATYNETVFLKWSTDADSGALTIVMTDEF